MIGMLALLGGVAGAALMASAAFPHVRRRVSLRLAAIAPAVLCAACHAVIPIASVAGGGASVFTAMDTIVTDADAIIRTACQHYERGKAAADAVIATGLVAPDKAARVKAVELYGDAACAAPPDGDPLETAIWLGHLAGQVVTLTSEARADPQIKGWGG